MIRLLSEGSWVRSSRPAFGSERLWPEMWALLEASCSTCFCSGIPAPPAPPKTITAWDPRGVRPASEAATSRMVRARRTT